MLGGDRCSARVRGGGGRSGKGDGAGSGDEIRGGWWRRLWLWKWNKGRGRGKIRQREKGDFLWKHRDNIFIFVSTGTSVV